MANRFDRGYLAEENILCRPYAVLLELSSSVVLFKSKETVETGLGRILITIKI
jgi:hypothetical protein